MEAALRVLLIFAVYSTVRPQCPPPPSLANPCAPHTPSLSYDNPCVGGAPPSLSGYDYAPPSSPGYDYAPPSLSSYDDYEEPIVFHGNPPPSLSASDCPPPSRSAPPTHARLGLPPPPSLSATPPHGRLGLPHPPSLSAPPPPPSFGGGPGGPLDVHGGLDIMKDHIHMTCTCFQVPHKDCPKNPPPPPPPKSSPPPPPPRPAPPHHPAPPPMPHPFPPRPAPAPPQMPQPFPPRPAPPPPPQDYDYSYDTLNQAHQTLSNAYGADYDNDPCGFVAAQRSKRSTEKKEEDVKPEVPKPDEKPEGSTPKFEEKKP